VIFGVLAPLSAIFQLYLIMHPPYYTQYNQEKYCLW